MAVLATLDFLEIKNFKSFEGTHKLGPFSPFTIIAGRNGIGKSNLMDAAAFALGEELTNLRVTEYNALTSTSSTTSTSNTAVTITFVVKEDQSRKHFMRTVTDQSTEFEIDGERVDKEMYLEELNTLGFNVKVVGFLLYQGTVDQIVLMDPIQLREMFEEVCRSCQFKERYNDLLTAMNNANFERMCSYEKMRHCCRQLQDASGDLKRYEAYSDAQEELKQKEQELKLLALYHNDKDISTLLMEKETVQQNIERNKANLDEVVNIVNERKEEMEALFVDIECEEEKVFDQKMKLALCRSVIDAEEQLQYISQKGEELQRILDGLSKSADDYDQNISKLQGTLLEEEDNISKRLEMQLQVGDKSVDLNVEQMEEYDLLKQEVVKRVPMSVAQSLASLKRAQNDDNEQLDVAIFKRSELERECERTNKKIKKAVEAKDKHEESVRSFEDKLSKWREDLEKLELTNARTQGCRKELASVIEAIHKAQETLEETIHDVTDRKCKADNLDRLRVFVNNNSICGRLGDLCEPTEDCYDLVVGKILGSYADAIVVNDQNTAQRCIQYLIEHDLEHEVFLPLEEIQAALPKDPPKSFTVNGDIESEPALKVIAVLGSNRPAVRFATDDALVLINASEDDLKKFPASDVFTRVFTSDGRFCMENCILSCSETSNVGDDSEMSDDMALLALEKRKEELLQELQSLARNEKVMWEMRTFSQDLRYETNSDVFRSMMAPVESACKIAKADCFNAEKEIQALEANLHQLQEKLTSSQVRINTIRSAIAAREEEIDLLEKSYHIIEDEIFAGFCASVGINNIREYEKQESEHQEMLKKQSDVECVKNQIQDELDLVKKSKNDILVKKRRLDDCLKRYKILSNSARENLERETQIRKKEKDILRSLTTKLSRLKKKAEMDQSALVSVEAKMRSKVEHEKNLQKRLLEIEVALSKLEVIKNGYLFDCYSHDIDLPLSSGNLRQYLWRLTTNGAEDNPLRDNVDLSPSQSPISSDDSGVSMDFDSNLAIQFDSLGAQYMDMKENEVQDRFLELEASIDMLKRELEGMNIIDRNASESVKAAEKKVNDSEKIAKQAEKTYGTIKASFEAVKEKRLQPFMECFSFIAEKFDRIFKKLMKSNEAEALLTLGDRLDPFSAGIEQFYSFPQKPMIGADGYSGGERTLLALALVRAFDLYNQNLHFFVFG